MKIRFLVLIFLFCALCFASCASFSFAQNVTQETAENLTRQDTARETPIETAQQEETKKIDFEFNLDLNSKVIPLPKIFSPSIDLSGRGSHPQVSWPYHLAAKEVLERWQKEVGFNKGIFRLYWNIWELDQIKLDRDLKKALLANYESILKNISDAGGLVIVTLYGTPPGMGEALDKRSSPSSLKKWKVLVKNAMRYLSVEKKYNVWYEVWSAPDCDDFFLGTKKDYLNLYRMAAEAARELQREKKVNLFIGGPAVTWWFQNLDGNTAITPENSLIYELIGFCRKRRLPLDFISWHAYSTDPKTEKESTVYNKTISALIREWLKYFRFKQDVPLIVDEWNFDNGLNVTEERSEKSYITSSFIPARLKNMYEAGIDYQIFFALEDFQDNADGINTNRGLFYYDPAAPVYTGGAKSMFNVFLMLKSLGDKLLNVQLPDEFTGVLATKKDGDFAMLIWNYIDPLIARNYLTRHITTLSEKGRKVLLNLFKSGKFDKIISGELSLAGLNLTDKLSTLLKNAIELEQKAKSMSDKPLNVKINIHNIKGDYIYQLYSVDSDCAMSCPFAPIEEKEVSAEGTLEQVQSLNPYSVKLIVLKKKPEGTQEAGGQQ